MKHINVTVNNIVELLSQELKVLMEWFVAFYFIIVYKL